MGGIMSDTTSEPGQRKSNRNRWRGSATALAVGLGLTGLAGAATACVTPPKPPTTTTTTTTGPGGQPRDCRVIDFEKATVESVPSAATTPRHRLVVSGTKPSLSQTVSLRPVTYIQQPEYWAIEVTACDPPQAGLPATGPYTATLDLTGSLGTRGITVVGATRSQNIDVDAAGRPAPLQGTVWLLDTASLGVPVPAGAQAIRIEFGPSAVTGGSGCNIYNAGYTAAGARLTFGPVATTRKACEPAVMAAENAYLARLGAVTTHRLDAGVLTLTGPQGSLRFSSAPR
jgi:heat shock protein HslJ